MAVSNIYGTVENMYWDVTHFRYNTFTVENFVHLGQRNVSLLSKHSGDEF